MRSESVKWCRFGSASRVSECENEIGLVFSRGDAIMPRSRPPGRRGSYPHRGQMPPRECRSSENRRILKDRRSRASLGITLGFFDNRLVSTRCSPPRKCLFRPWHPLCLSHSPSGHVGCAARNELRWLIGRVERTESRRRRGRLKGVSHEIIKGANAYRGVLGALDRTFPGGYARTVRVSPRRHCLREGRWRRRWRRWRRGRQRR